MSYSKNNPFLRAWNGEITWAKALKLDRFQRTGRVYEERPPRPDVRPARQSPAEKPLAEP